MRELRKADSEMSEELRQKAIRSRKEYRFNLYDQTQLVFHDHKKANVLIKESIKEDKDANGLDLNDED